jgi:hypothetical protein
MRSRYMERMKESYIAYGNEPCLWYVYSMLCLIVEKAKERRAY